MLKMITHVSGWKALIMILIAGAIAIFAGGFKVVKVIGWALVAVIAFFAAYNEIKS